MIKVMKTNIIQLPNPNGPRGTNNPTLVVIHAMGEYIWWKGKFWHAVDFLTAIGFSAHSLITPSGVNLRLRHDSEMAHHAKGHNINSLGIELLVPGAHNYGTFLATMKTDWVTEAAYETALEQVKYWNNKFPIDTNITHADLDPTRKYDPGTGFPKQFFTDIITN